MEWSKVYQPYEEELGDNLDPYEKFYCTECHDGGELLLCDICDSAAHSYCVGLGYGIPEGSWFCPRCKPASTIAAKYPDPTNDYGAKAPTLETLDLSKMCVSDTPLPASAREGGCIGRSISGPDAIISPYQIIKSCRLSEEELRDYDYLDPEDSGCLLPCDLCNSDVHTYSAYLLVCELCDSVVHTYCAFPGDEMPQESWYCCRCKPTALSSTNAAQSLNPTPDYGAPDSLSSRL